MNYKRLPIILGLSTGTFPHQTSAKDSLMFALRAQAKSVHQDNSILKKLYTNTAIKSRCLAIPDFIENSEDHFFNESFSMPVDQRLYYSIEIAAPFVADVASAALKQAQVDVSEVAQLIIVTSTAIGSPGIEQKLSQMLGLPNNVMQASVNYMGCAAGVTGLRLASDFIKGLEVHCDNQVSLLVCIETSSLHTSMEQDTNNLVTHSLFADGIACSVIGKQRQDCEHLNLLAILGFESLQLSDCLDGIQLTINPNGIACELTRDLPNKLASGVKDWYRALLNRHNSTIEELGFWAIHPGGRKIIEKAVQGLSIHPDNAKASWNVLGQYGNVLSCGIFFVLKEMLDNKLLAKNQKGVAFSFSPGVRIEGVLLKALADS